MRYYFSIVICTYAIFTSPLQSNFTSAYALIAGACMHSIDKELKNIPPQLRHIARCALHELITKNTFNIVNFSEKKIQLSTEYMFHLYNGFIQHSIQNTLNTALAVSSVCINNEYCIIANILLKDLVTQGHKRAVADNAPRAFMRVEELYKAYSSWQHSYHLAQASHKSLWAYISIKYCLKIFQLSL